MFCVTGSGVREAVVRHQRRAADCTGQVILPEGTTELAAGSDREDQIRKDKYEDKGENKATRRGSLGHSTGHSRGTPDQRHSRELQRHSSTPALQNTVVSNVLDQEPKELLIVRLLPASVLRRVQYGYSTRGQC